MNVVAVVGNPKLASRTRGAAELVAERLAGGPPTTVIELAELASEPLAQVEYVSVADATTLVELDTVDGPALASLAVRFGTTRLIDNEPLG